MKCRFPVTEVDGITIAVLPCQENADRLGLLLHPASNDRTQSSSRQLYHVSWSFRERTGSGYDLFRLACLGGDVDNLRKLASIPAPYSRRFRDDITVTVVWWEDGREGQAQTEQVSIPAPEQQAKAKL